MTRLTVLIFNGGIKIIEKTNIYFIGSTEMMAVKIGKSNNPKKRLAGLQTGNSHKLTLFAVIEDVPHEYEKELHELMDHIHIKGEWFKLTNELIHFMVNKNTATILGFKGELFNNDPQEVFLDKAIDKLISWSGDCTDFISDSEILNVIDRYAIERGIELNFDSNNIRYLTNKKCDGKTYRTYLNGKFGYHYYKINWDVLN